jgi:hypothetical protein
MKRLLKLNQSKLQKKRVLRLKKYQKKKKRRKERKRIRDRSQTLEMEVSQTSTLGSKHSKR